MITFLLGLALLLVGGKVYGGIAERAMRPVTAETPAVRMRDGVDFVPMDKQRNSLIELLNIAGTGPVLGPVQGALFGAAAFLTIPIGCVIGGAFHFAAAASRCRISSGASSEGKPISYSTPSSAF